ncbi:MAG: hypothetical protein QW041_01530 [Candidatus Pacearchaeota archaeon]
MVETLKVNVASEKAKIIAFLEKSGPVVSNTIAKALNLNSFLTAALLSELVKEKQINASFIRVGGSPLYYLNGQEEQLERFVSFLKNKEREAYEILKKEGVLQDSKLEPAIRVAIRDVKDFAIPLSVNNGKEEILFWKYRFFNEADKKIKELLTEQEIIKEEKDEPLFVKEVKKEKKKLEKAMTVDKILEKWANENKVFIKELILAKGKDAKAKVVVKSEIGDIDFLLILKNKKNITEADLSLAYQDGLNFKIPVIFLTPGKLSKSTQQYLDCLGKNLILRKL